MTSDTYLLRTAGALTGRAMLFGPVYLLTHRIVRSCSSSLCM